jgi:hypothetical protein
LDVDFGQHVTSGRVSHQADDNVSARVGKNSHLDRFSEDAPDAVKYRHQLRSQTDPQPYRGQPQPHGTAPPYRQ